MVLLPDGENLLERTVSDGWVKIREDAGKRENQPGSEAIIEKLRVLEGAAKIEGKGIWDTSDDGVIESKYESPPASEAVAFLEKYKGQAVAGELMYSEDFIFWIVQLGKLTRKSFFCRYH